jgi:hypothetical protein
MYYFTLKRPVNARYARQAGYDPDDSSPTVVDLANPQARGPEFDVRLPVPWRFEAGLKTLPSASAAGRAVRDSRSGQHPDGHRARRRLRVA